MYNSQVDDKMLVINPTKAHMLKPSDTITRLEELVRRNLINDDIYRAMRAKVRAGWHLDTVLGHIDYLKGITKYHAGGNNAVLAAGIAEYFTLVA
jgi:riboflavin synthase alpha subunit